MEKAKSRSVKQKGGINVSAKERDARIWSAVQVMLAKDAKRKGSEIRNRLKTAGLKPADIATYADFTRIPPLPKKELIRLQAEDISSLVSVPLGELSRIYLSPGPIFDPEARGEDSWGWTEAFVAAGFKPGDIVQMTFSYHLTPAGLMLEQPLKAIGCAVIPAGPGNTDTQIDLLTRLKVTGFVGMTSFLKIIGDKAKEKGLKLKKDFALRVAFVAAERLTPALRKDVEKAFGMTVRQGYGTADVGCIAYECEKAEGMHLSSRCLVEICEPGTGIPVPPGELGEVVVTPLCGAYPLFRLATGDLSRLEVKPCACGRKVPRLAGILGRTDTTVKVKGQFIYAHQVAEVMAKHPAVTAWQVVVTNPHGKDWLALKISAKEGLDEKTLISDFQTVLKLRPALERHTQGWMTDGAKAIEDLRTWDA